MPEPTPADRRILDGIARQLHDEDPVVFHGSEGGKDCPHCGRGDAGPSADQWLTELDRLCRDLEHAKRVARSAARDAADALTRQLVAEARADRAEHAFDAERETSRRLLDQRQEMAEERYAWQERGDRAEAAIKRVREVCDRIEAAVRSHPQHPDFDGAYLAAIRHIREALNPQEQP